MHTINDIPTQYWKDGELVDYTEQERQELLQKWNEDAARIEEHNNKEYQRDRAIAYPSIQEQLDLLYWDKVNGTDNWEQAIAAVKAEYPKG
jgi:YD repeat-containing protein